MWHHSPGDVERHMMSMTTPTQWSTLSTNWRKFTTDSTAEWVCFGVFLSILCKFFVIFCSLLCLSGACFSHTHCEDFLPFIDSFSWINLILQMKRAILHQTHYVELLLVVDNDRVRHTDTLGCQLIKYTWLKPWWSDLSQSFRFLCDSHLIFF